MAELLGAHSYQLDPKGRLSLPARFREALADGVVRIAEGLDRQQVALRRDAEEGLDRLQSTEGAPVAANPLGSGDERDTVGGAVLRLDLDHEVGAGRQ